jgi:alpha-1,6-mannosyltransferase
VNGRRLIALGACGAALLGLTALGLYAQSKDNLALFLAAALGQSAVYLISVWLVWNAVSPRPVFWLIILVAGVARLPLLVAPPYLSSDIYRYIWDGRVAAAGINPYRYIPTDPQLEALRDPEIFPQINRNNYALTIYPPVGEAIFLAVTRIGESVTTMKAAMIGFEIMLIAVLWRLLGAAGLPTTRILVYAWHPLSLWEFAGSGHIDAAMIAFIALALSAGLAGREVWTALALAAATLIKLYPAVLIPAFYRRWTWRMPTVFGAMLVLCYLPFVDAGWRVFGFLPEYFGEEGFDASGTGFYLRELLQLLPPFAGLPAMAYPIGAATVLVVLAVATVYARSTVDAPFAAAAVLAGAFTMLLSPHYPWYFTWLIVFACFLRALSLLWLTNACLLLYLVPVGSHIVRDPYRLLVETVMYGPFIVMAMSDVWYHHRPTNRSP